MITINSHCHTQFSDGQLSIEETAILAKEKGLTHLYFTDHHIPNDHTNTIDFERYFREIDQANMRVSPELRLYKGVELDFFKGEEDWFIEQSVKGFDFILGAVHMLTDRKIYPMELPYQEHRELTILYFQEIKRLAESRLADSIAHFDLVKFSSNENSDWYRKEVVKTIEVIADSKTAIEINTSGVRKGSYEFNPSTWILHLAHNMGIQLTIGTDSHNPNEHLTYMLEEAVQVARNVGYTRIVRYENRRPIFVPI
jgi:histidinol-phosphatase (PHP family)